MTSLRRSSLVQPF